MKSAAADDSPATDHADGRFSALVAQGRAVADKGQRRFEGLLAKYQDRVLVEVALSGYRRDRDTAGSVVGATIAFRLFLFFVPLLLFVVGIAGFVGSFVEADDLNDQARVAGSLAAQVGQALNQPESSRWIAVLVGLFGMVTAGRSLSKVLVSASCLAWRLPAQRPQMRLLGGIIGLAFGIGLVSIIVNRVRADLGLAVVSLSFVAAFVLYGLAWLGISMMLPRATNEPGVLLPGAALIGVSIAVMQAVSQLYVPAQFDHASDVYGAIGVTVVSLGWFFILGRIMVLGMTLNAVIYERFGTITSFIFALPVIRILPRRFPRLRHFFGLDEEGP